MWFSFLMQRPSPRSPRRPAKSLPKTVPTWVLVWVALTLLVIILFLANRGTIDQVIKTTGFVEAVQGSALDEAPATEVSEEPLVAQPTAEERRLLEEAQDELIKDIPPETPQGTQAALPPVAPEETPKSEVSQTPAEEVKKRPATLYFVTVNGDGAIAMAPVVRPVPVGNSPLTATLTALLAGPTPEELSRGYLNLIPTGSRLLAVRMEGNTAVLSFSDDFQFNSLGMEGYSAQLNQIIYTATEFSTVKKVKILIEGKTREFLGSEAIPIGEPLDRSSLNR